MKFLALLWLGLNCLVYSCGGGFTAWAKDPISERKRSVHEEITLESIGKGSFVVVACPFAFEMKKLSPEKYEIVMEYAVVKVFNGKLNFGAKFKVARLVEGALEERPAALKPSLGNFEILVLFDQPNLDQPFEVAHSLPYSKELEIDVTQLLQKKSSEPKPASAGTPVK